MTGHKATTVGHSGTTTRLLASVAEPSFVLRETYYSRPQDVKGDFVCVETDKGLILGDDPVRMALSFCLLAVVSFWEPRPISFQSYFLTFSQVNSLVTKLREKFPQSFRR